MARALRVYVNNVVEHSTAGDGVAHVDRRVQADEGFRRFDGKIELVVQPTEARLISDGGREHAGQRGDGVARALRAVASGAFVLDVNLTGVGVDLAIGREFAAERPFLGELVIYLGQPEVVTRNEGRGKDETARIEAVGACRRKIVRRRIEAQVFEG